MKRLKLENENKLLKAKLKQYSEINGGCPWIDDKHLKGGFRVVRTIQERDNIPCCNRKQGMKVLVVGAYTYKEYILVSKKCENEWLEIDSGFESGTSIHNNLLELQGGEEHEYYHITEQQHSAIENASSPSSSNPFATISDINNNVLKWTLNNW